MPNRNDAEQYVRTKDIRSAVRGREIEILGILGIDRKQRVHIKCPYGDHDDRNPSWRFDQQKGLAFCTCINGSHSVFDVVGKIRGLDFNAAKVFVAEGLRLQHLIRKKTATPAKMSPAALLSPPIELRDDALVRAYLAGRLKVDRAAVPMPATATVGWTKLPFFGSPSPDEPSSKAIHVGDYPCAVFATAAADGREHAHRIYLAEGGEGKAELGSGLNPKKSAVVPKGQNAAGCSVMWGDPKHAPHIIVAEGIETAAALALVYADKIARREIAVAAALSTSGMRAFSLWPATVRVTIAADRDEAGDSSKRQGEFAARALAVRIHEKVQVEIALPDVAGEAIDFLDELLRNRPEGVEASLAQAKRYEPTLEELKDRQPAGADLIELPAEAEGSLAERFAERYADTLRYEAASGVWRRWDSMRWQRDDTLFVRDKVRELCREAAATAGHPRTAITLFSIKTVSSVERLAMCDRRLAASGDQWDRDLWLLNTPGGVVDLRTGALSGHRPEDFMTKMTATTPDPSCPTPFWLGFLMRVTEGKQELVEFLQRIAGYSLTGSTREHAMFFLCGPGGNGKSVFMSAIAGVMGDYHRAAPIETFTSYRSDRHPTDLAGLQGARLVTAIETEEGRLWAEAKMKSLTGGDTISARFMRQDFFDFVPQFKLLIAGNHKPGLRSVDEAIQRRFHLIPFTATISPDERDEQLGERLRAEWPGILAWAIDGCTDWLERGSLAPPEIVTAATREYMAAEDIIETWRKEACEFKDGARTSTTALYMSFANWAQMAGERNIPTRKAFSQKLEVRGLVKYQGRDNNGFLGITVKGCDPPEAPRWMQEH